MVEATTAERAERLSRRRARLLPILAVIYLGQQYSYFSSDEPGRAVDHVRIGAWAVMSLVLLIALMSGGGLLRGSEMRAMLNDETTRVHRAAALSWGFVVAMLTGIALYIVQDASIDAREAIHLIVSLGIATALICFGLLERRAMRGQ